MNDDLKNLVRSEWFAYFRWTAGLSTFLVGISLTILALIHKNIEPYSMVILIIADVVLLANIILTMRLLRIGLFDVYHKLAFDFLPRYKLMWYERLVKNSESLIKWLFRIGIIIFLSFPISYWAGKTIIYYLKYILGYIVRMFT